MAVRVAGRAPAQSSLHTINRLRPWIWIPAIVILPLLLWLSTGVASTLFGHPSTALRGLAILIAYAGVTSFAMNLLISTRLPILERIFGGLGPMYRAHRRIGQTTLVLLVVHATFMTASMAVLSPTAALNLFVPTGSWEVFAGVIALTSMLVMILLPLLRKMEHEKFVKIHRFIGVIFLIGGYHFLNVPGLKVTSQAVVGYLYILFAIGVAAYMYRAVLGRILVKRYGYQVEAVNKLGPNAVEIVMAPLKKRLSFQPGQFVFITIVHEGVRRETHPFSITSASNDPKLRLLVKALGDFTTRLQRLPPGATVHVEGPFGRFSHEMVENHRQIWIAGGVGVTPFLSMARSMDFCDRDVDFFYATEHSDEAYFLNELFTIADNNPRLRVVPVRKASLGHITAKDIEGINRTLTDKDIFICGPPAMMRNLKQQFVALGVSPDQIHFEDFGAISA